MSSTALAKHSPDIKSALRSLKGTATLGDIVAATGLPRDQAESGLKSLLETYRGHLAVSDSGEMIYQFDPKLVTRDAESFLTRFKRGAWSVFQVGFKAWIAVTLVVYFTLFVALVVAAIIAANKGDGDNNWGGGRRRGGSGLGDFFFWYWMFGGSRGRRGPYFGHRHAKRLGKEARPPFYKKVFAFVFGPEEPEPNQLQKDRSVLRLIRARAGVLSPAEIVEHTALPLPDAEEEVARLTGAYGGEPHVTDEGELVYAFPELMTSAHGKVTVKEPNPAWLRLERPKELTGNDTGSNAVIVGMNAFNLIAAATAPWFIFPRLGIGGLAAFIGLVAVPTAFSAMFFGVPLLRKFGLKRENKRRLARNIRRVLLSHVYKNSVGTVRWVPSGDAIAVVEKRLNEAGVAPKVVVRELEKIAAEFDADVQVNDYGDTEYKFPKIREAFVAGELARRSLRLEERRVGDIVYDTSDSSAEASERDLHSFDRELQAAELDLSKYLPSPDKTGYEDDFEVVMEALAERR